MSRKISKIILSLVCICSVLMTLLFVLAVEYRSSASTQLPESCRKWSFRGSISEVCRADIANMQKAPTAPAPLCYDNDRYVNCEDFARDVVQAKQSLAFFAAISAVSGALAVALRTRKDKK